MKKKDFNHLTKNEFMKKNLALTCLAYLFFGVGVTVQQLGKKAGLSAELTLGIFLLSLLFFLIVAFTSMEKLKTFIFNQYKEPVVKSTKYPSCGDVKKSKKH